MTETDNVHIPVLLDETIRELNLVHDDIVIDGTLGGGGHASAIAEQLGEQGILIGFDADAQAIARAQKRLEGVKPQLHFIESNFRHVKAKLSELGIPHITKAVFDLGLSSNQLENSGRGFKFQKDEPLGMTFETNPGEGVVTAREIVNDWSEETIADIIYGYSEDRFSRKIARAIVAAREESPIETTTQLAQIVFDAVPPRFRKPGFHPATKTFQALRMAVNDELGALTDALTDTFEVLKPGGRVAVISFHSLEDRIVKRFFKEKVDEGVGEATTKKPIGPSREEVEQNPRARSSKLRVLIKLSA